MSSATNKQRPSESATLEEKVKRMTPQNRATYEWFIQMQKGKEGLVDTAALIREIRGS